jgi:uncharacterized surface protein with fasciclin (FAS1) repeats
MKYYYIALLCLVFVACQRWDDRLQLSEVSIGNSLYEGISVQPNLSKFKDLLIQSGYDKIIGSSKNYTVFAPTNAALEKIDLTTLKDTSALKAFVGNHIALQSFPMPVSTEENRIRLMNGKYITLTKGLFGESNVLTANTYMANGVLHTIDKYVDVLPNLWEYVNNSKAEFIQNKIVANLNYLSFNPAKAIIDSISGTTGFPVYRKGTGFETKNQFSDLVYDFANENNQYTYFVLNDVALDAEIKKLTPYFKTSTADSTYNGAAWQTLKDLSIEGYYTADKLPTSMFSKFGVSIPVSKTAIVKSIKLSNGIVHVLNKVDFKVQEKIQTVVIQGESYFDQMQAIGSRTLVVRDKFNPISMQPFKDLSIIAHAVSNFWVRYRVPQLPAAKYKVYWVALNDQTRNHSSNALPITVNQRLAMGSLTNATFAYSTIKNNDYTEVLLGEYTTTNYRNLDIFLVANGTNSMALDYIKLVPVF